MDYLCRIGFEFHCVVNSKEKLFCFCKNSLDTLQVKANENICPTCTGLPGTLPIRVNRYVVEKAALLSRALECKTNDYLKFDRKHYIYRDLPKNYQITQFYHPIGVKGKLNLYENLNVSFKQIHIEEDAGRTQVKNGEYLVDFNRSGVPLIEMVTDMVEIPINKVEEFIKDFGNKLRDILVTLKISNCNMEKGQLRADVNFSLFKDGKFTERVEIKNLNSFKFMVDAVKYEIKKHKVYLEKSIKNDIETVLYDEKTQSTKTMRSKTTVVQYCYLPEPDIPLASFDREIFEKSEKTLSVYKKNITILNSNFTRNEINDIYAKKIDDFILNSSYSKKETYYWIKSFLRHWNTLENDKLKIVQDFLALIYSKKLSSSQSKVLFDTFFQDTSLGIEESFKKCNFVSSNNGDLLKNLITKYIDQEEDLIKKIKNGKHGAINNLIGIIMRDTKGKIDAKQLKEEMTKVLELSQ